MGLTLRARCARCGYERDGLRLGATHEQIAAHDIDHAEVFGLPCCGRLQSLTLRLGAPPAAATCEQCGASLAPEQVRRYRISTLKGEVLAGHPCPRCGEPALAFEVEGKFV